MTRPVTVQPGPSQRASEPPLIAPAPLPRERLRAPAATIRKSLRASIQDGLAWAVMQGAGTSYALPYIILKGSGLYQLAAFSGLPSLATGLVQWYGAHVTDRLGRRNHVIISGAFLQALTWFVFAGAIFLPFSVGYWVALAAFVAHVALGAFPLPAWQSLMGDLVPPDRRGRYFGLRNSLCGAVQMSAFFIAGWWLTFSEDTKALALLGLSSRSFGFFVLFATAGGARLLSTWFLTRVHEPTYQRQPSDRFTLLEFIRRAPRAHFGRFVIYCALIHLAFGLNGPYLGWYLLDQLKFSTGAFAAIITAGLVAGVLSQPLWGRLSDRIGSKRVLVIGGYAIVFTPLVMLPCSSFWHFLLALAYDGIAGAAFAIAVGNYFFDVVTPAKRARCIAYNTLFLAVGGLVGAFAGAIIATAPPIPVVAAHVTIGHPFALLLISSAFVRLLAGLLLLSTFAEFRLRRPTFAPPNAHADAESR